MMKKEEKEYYEKLVKKYREMIYRIAFSNVKNKADAEDIVQDTFIRCIRKKPEFQNEIHEKAWLIRTTIHISYDLLKSPWYKKTISLEEIKEGEINNFQLPYMEMDDTLYIVMQLPFIYRIVIYLFYYEDYSIKEIATILKEKEGTIKTRLRRGREQVKKQLQEYNGDNIK